MYNPFSLEGKTILITGASSGIGKAIAIECSKMGATMVISGRNEERLNNTFKQLEGSGHISIVADLQSDEGLKQIASQLSSLNGVVNCAGLAKLLPFQYITDVILKEILTINFTAPALLSKEIVKRKIIQKNSSIIFISSISGVLCSSVGGALYSASKGAVNGLVKGMALDLASRGIRVNSVCPGMIDTKIFKEESFTMDQIDQDKKKYPLGRYGRPEEVAYAVIYLLSDASSWVTGSNIIIDGGYTLI